MKDIFDAYKDRIQFNEDAIEYKKHIDDIIPSVKKRKYAYVSEKDTRIQYLAITKRHTYDYVVVDDVTVTPFGILVQNEDVYYVNGRLAAGDAGLAQVTRDAIRANVDAARNCDAPVVDTVVVLSGIWGGEIYHFAYDCITRLPSVPDAYLRDERVQIHLTRYTKYHSQFCDLLSIPGHAARVVTGTVRCRRAIVPRSPYWGSANIDCNTFVKERILSISAACAEPPCIVLTKRTFKRGLLEDVHAQVVAMLTVFAEKKELVLVIHDDAALPPLAEQYRLFYRAKYVFGPHGAAGICLYGMQPGSVFVEFMPTSRRNASFVPHTATFSIDHYVFEYNDIDSSCGGFDTAKLQREIIDVL